MRGARARSGIVPGALLSLWAIVVPLLPSGVSAHVFPDHSEPRVGRAVEAPRMVRIWFDGEIEPVFSTIRVENDAKKRVDGGDGRVNPRDGTLLEVSLPVLPPGPYRVHWSVVARDGHRTDGSYPFWVK